MTVDILNQYAPPGKDGMLLGSEQGGRNIFIFARRGDAQFTFDRFCSYLVIPSDRDQFWADRRVLRCKVDNVMMRFLDFMMTLPMLMLIIVIVSIIPNYSMTSFVLIMSAFYWIGTARFDPLKNISRG